MFNQTKMKKLPPKKTGGKNTASNPGLGLPVYGCIGLGVLCLVLAGTTYNYMDKSQHAMKVAGALNNKVKELQQPKYNEKYDFLTNQCGEQAYCVDNETNNPSLEIYKFLVNFREQPNLKYRLFFEVSVGKTNVTQPFKYSCDSQDSNFYICQEITATSPTDVMRVFATSYKTLSRNASYSFNLMVKPIGEIEEAAPVKMKPDPNLVVKPLPEQESKDSSKQQATSEPVGETESTVVDKIPSEENPTIAERMVAN